MPTERRSYEKFLKFPETPIILKPFNPKARILAEEYEEILNKVLEVHSIRAELFGSTALGISGKGELEFAIYLEEANWQDIRSTLEKEYGQPVAVKPDRIRFDTIYKDTDVEIVMKKGEDAYLGKAVMKFFLSNPDELARYEELKHRYAHSEREYNYQKAQYLSDLTDTLLES